MSSLETTYTEEQHHQEYSSYVSHQKKDKEILDEIHLGCCGNYTTSRTLVGKAFHTEFY
jgi:hypothetical protein